MQADRFKTDISFECIMVACTGRIEDRDSPVNFSAEWTVSADAQLISFTVMAMTNGYLAIGFQGTD